MFVRVTRDKAGTDKGLGQGAFDEGWRVQVRGNRYYIKEAGSAEWQASTLKVSKKKRLLQLQQGHQQGEHAVDEAAVAAREVVESELNEMRRRVPELEALPPDQAEDAGVIATMRKLLGLRRDHWTPLEDKIILDSVRDAGGVKQGRKHRWPIVAKEIPMQIPFHFTLGDFPIQG